MSKTSPNSDIHDEPRTLCSKVLSYGIPIRKPSHLSSMSIESNILQISQSPTRGFVIPGDNGQSKMSGERAFCMNTDLREESVNGLSIPSDRPPTTNHTGSASHTSVDTKGSGKEKLVSEEKRDEQAKQQEQTGQLLREDFSASLCAPRNVYTDEPSRGASFHEETNPTLKGGSGKAFMPPPEIIDPSPVASLSETVSSLKFFSFVILHVQEDQEEAGRICGILNDLSIGEGTTFCEGFETAGVSPLRCLEDAVENSAYIVLLLTNGFLSKWGEFQTNTVLKNSIDDANKSGTVIPFISKVTTAIDKRLRDKMPLCVRSIIPLDENYSLFEKRVQNTFKRDVIKRQRERWQKVQDARALERRSQDARDFADFLRLKERFEKNLLEFPSSLPSQIIQGPVYQIHNASYVQIGDQNQMNVHQSTAAPQMEMHGEHYQEYDKENQSEKPYNPFI